MEFNKHRFLTEEQSTAIQHLNEPMAMIAGAGSGKTTVLVERYLALLQSGHKPQSILTVTFTTDAALELKERILSRLKSLEMPHNLIVEVENTANIGTIHSFSYRVLNQFNSLLNLTPIEEITDDFELTHLFSERYRNWMEQLPDSSLTGLLKYFTHTELKDMAQQLFLEHFTFEQSTKLIGQSSELPHKMIKRLLDLFRPLFLELKKELQTKGRYTFHDLETLTLELVSRFTLVKQRLQSDYTSVLIDEFQDTSRLQWSILREILDPEWKKLFVVGDPKQSIYGFRFADVSLFKEVSDEINRKNGIVRELKQNFRTQGTLLEDLNQVSQALFEGSFIRYSDMKAGRSDSGLNFSVQELTPISELSRTEVQKVEVQSIANYVAELHGKLKENETIAVLFRNGDRLLEYQEALSERGIPATLRTSTSLFEYYEIRDLVAFLRAVENPLDTYALASFLRSDFVKMPIQEFLKLFESKDRNLLESLMEQNPSNLNWYFEVLESGKTDPIYLIEMLYAKTHTRLNFLEGVLRLLKPLAAISIDVAISKLSIAERRGVSVDCEETALGDSVRLMTVHGAKGLEFSHVVLADTLRQMPYRTPTVILHPGEVPGIRYREEEGAVESPEYKRLLEKTRMSDLEEAKRILYVGLTRAKESLTVFLPRNLKSIPKGSWAQLLLDAEQMRLQFTTK